MRTDDYHYHLNQAHRADLLREACKQQLLRQAERQSSNGPRRTAALLTLLQSLFR